MPAWTTILTVLDRSPNLMSLVTQTFLPTDGPQPMEAIATRVTLPCLRRLHLFESSSNLAMMLNSLALPVVEDVEVGSNSNDITAPSFHELLTVLGGLFPRDTWRTLHLEREREMGDTIATVYSVSGSAPPSRRRVELTCRTSDVPQGTGLMDAFVASFPLGALSTLEVQILQGYPHPALKFWGTVAQLPALETLIVRCDPDDVDVARSDLFSLLRQHATLFPVLRDLRLIQLKLNNNGARGEAAFAALETMQAGRAALGRPVAVLLERCTFSDMLKKRLQSGSGQMRIVDPR